MFTNRWSRSRMEHVPRVSSGYSFAYSSRSHFGIPPFTQSLSMSGYLPESTTPYAIHLDNRFSPRYHSISTDRSRSSLHLCRLSHYRNLHWTFPAEPVSLKIKSSSKQAFLLLVSVHTTSRSVSTAVHRPHSYRASPSSCSCTDRERTIASEDHQKRRMYSAESGNHLMIWIFLTSSPLPSRTFELTLMLKATFST